MPYYETVFIARQELSDTQIKELTDSLSKIITDEGGKITRNEDWGLRTLAFRMNKSRKGRYIAIECDTPSAAIIELERVMRLNEDIMRTLTLRLDELSDGPSVMLEKPKRDDRDNRDNKDSTAKKEAA